MLPLRRDARWLFVGDSITDCGRRDERPDDPQKLGVGYVRIIGDWLLARDPLNAPTLLNRGVGGDTIRDVAERWQRDVIDEAPDVMSLKIGINDVWRQLYGKPTAVPLSEYTQTYGELLNDLVTARPGVRLVLCEPSVISPPEPAEGNRTVLAYAMAVREVAAQFKDHVAFTVPFHGVCVEAESQRPDVDWWPDGVHPSQAGATLLARTWLNEAGLL